MTTKKNMAKLTLMSFLASIVFSTVLTLSAMATNSSPKDCQDVVAVYSVSDDLKDVAQNQTPNRGPFMNFDGCY